MLSSVLRSKRAVDINIEIMRAFVRCAGSARSSERARAQTARPAPCCRRIPGSRIRKLEAAPGEGQLTPDQCLRAEVSDVGLNPLCGLSGRLQV